MSASGSVSHDGVTVSFGDRFVATDRFRDLYQRGMALVEDTAFYLDGDGRREARRLKGRVSMTYASESMRLSTRLMQLASWLLIRRAVSDGQMTRDRGRLERRKLKLDTIGRPNHVADWDQLPARLRELIELSFALHDEILRLDMMFEGRPADTPEAVVAASISADGAEPGGAQIIPLRPRA